MGLCLTAITVPTYRPTSLIVICHTQGGQKTRNSTSLANRPRTITVPNGTTNAHSNMNQIVTNTSCRVKANVPAASLLTVGTADGLHMASLGSQPTGY